ARDVRIDEAREDRSLPAKPLLPRAAHETRVQELHGGGPLEAAVASTRPPDAAHAALADRLDERVGAHSLAGERSSWRRRRERLLEECAPRVLVVNREQALDARGERGIPAPQLLEPRRALLLRQVERAFEMRLELPPELVSHALARGGVSSRSALFK